MYAAAIGTRHVFEIAKMTNWRQLGSWGKGTHGHFEFIVTLTEKLNPYVSYLRNRFDVKIIAVTPDGWAKHFGYYATLKPWEFGWGVDKERFSSIADNRRGVSKPAFHMLSRDSAIEHRLDVLGYDIHYGDLYYLSQVALEPSEVFVPIRMYEAAASGMPVVSVKANGGWTKTLGVYGNLFLDDSVDKVAREVADSDFLYAGMIARDMVPDLAEFGSHVRAILNGFEQ